MIRPIPGYEGLYSITSNGHVFSHGRITNHNSRKGVQTIKGKRLNPKEKPYKGVLLYDKNGIGTDFYIHHLVMKTFGPSKPSNKHQINHKDCNKTNNKISNLEWVTPMENTTHAIVNGHRPMNTEHFGVENGRSKLTEKDIIIIRQKHGQQSMRSLAKQFSVSVQNISSIIHHKTWKHI